MLNEGLFADNALVFKGGTALRKFQFGKAGRFSTDLDLWASDRGTSDYVIGMLDTGFSHENVTFGLIDFTREGDAHAKWWAECPELGRTREPSAVEFSFRHRFRDPSMPTSRPNIPGVDGSMGFPPVLVPLYDLLENAAEKIARVRRMLKSRDLYDLALIGPRLNATDLRIIRRLTAWKVFLDVHENLRTPVPFRGGPDFRDIDPREVGDMRDIGRLAVRNMTADEMCNKLGQYFGRMGEPADDFELRLARCGLGDYYWADRMKTTWDQGM
jgi:hypothetical protein